MPSEVKRYECLLQQGYPDPTTLKAVHDRLVECRDTYGTSSMIAYHQALLDTYDALAQRLKVDTKRLDWLQTTESGVYYHFGGFGPMWEITSLPEHRFAYKTVREAIDAAMKDDLRQLQEKARLRETEEL